MDIVRVLGVFLVVLGHLVNTHPVRMYIYAFHMPMFFIVSGLLFKSKNSIKELKVFRKYIIPAVFFTLLFQICWYVVRLLFSLSKLSLSAVIDVTIETFKRIAVDLVGIVQFNPFVENIPVWFLFALAWCYIFHFFSNKNRLYALIPLVIIVMSQWEKLPLFCSQGAFAYPFFAFGYLAKERVLDGFKQKNWKTTVVSTILLIAVVLIIPINGYVSMYQCSFGELPMLFSVFSYYAVSITMSICLIYLFGSLPRFNIDRPVNYVAQSFITILGIQYFFTTLYGRTIGFDIYLIIEIFTAALIVLACCIIHRIIFKISPKLVGKQK
ncbi:acyltransferase family protein [Bacteroides nordii]|uniref:acyltransferase family protein n=1 Tax=Bacteroides nordii TaxID=291645 RepID=UPI00242EB5AA|nr:acyltransferase family protein [Bacteroides nordii]